MTQQTRDADDAAVPGGSDAGAPVAEPNPDPLTGPDGDAGIEPPPVTPRAVTLSVATVLTALLVSGLALLPAPYAISSPGPTRDTLGEVGDTALITVDGAETHESSGELLLTTVSVAGGPAYPASLVDVLRGWADGARSVEPVEAVFAPAQSQDAIDAQNQAAMVSSQENATVAALEELGYEVPTVLHVAEPVEGTGSWGVVEPKDIIVSVDGHALESFSDLSARMDEVEPGAVVDLGVLRGGEPVTLEVTTVESDGRALLGVLVDPEFELPVDVSIEIENIGGPSAGTMFALGIIDTLTPEDETGGAVIAGTGTMDLAGRVGPIGGIRQKMAGALRDGATYFLAPEANCDEVVGHVPNGLQVVSVLTLGDAREAITAIGAGEGGSLPGCD